MTRPRGKRGDGAAPRLWRAPSPSPYKGEDAANAAGEGTGDGAKRGRARERPPACPPVRTSAGRPRARPRQASATPSGPPARRAKLPANGYPPPPPVNIVNDAALSVSAGVRLPGGSPTDGACYAIAPGSASAYRGGLRGEEGPSPSPYKGRGRRECGGRGYCGRGLERRRPGIIRSGAQCEENRLDRPVRISERVRIPRAHHAIALAL